jgi:hypothetical protein
MVTKDFQVAWNFLPILINEKTRMILCTSLS